MRTKEEFAKSLEDRNLSHVSRQTGLSIRTLWRIKNGQVSDMRLSTAITLEKYLNEHA
jgi:DNA-binding Xre family transcriptional regulator